MDIYDHLEPGKTGLEEKVAVVAGGGAPGDGIGNGRAAAICLARAGARLVVMDYLPDRAQRTVDMIVEEGGEAVSFSGDASCADVCENMVEMAMDTYGRLDVLDNNIGVGSYGSVVTETEDNWNQVMKVNINSIFLASKHAIPAMKSSGGGAIVNIGSISALRPRGLTAYSTSKGAVAALTQAMAIDHAAENIRVNCIVPGPVYTPMVYTFGMTEEKRKKRVEASPLKIEGTGWDIGHAATFLASPRARFITGQILVVDGGVTLASPER